MFTWQAVAYEGLIALLAEWQFNEFGIYLPLVTFLLFVLVLAPLPLLFARRSARARSGGAVGTPLARAVRQATRFLNALLLAAGGCLAAALTALILTLWLPDASGPTQRLDASVTRPETPAEGATELSGRILYNRTSAFDEHLWWMGRNVRFAPVVDKGVDDATIRYFVELAPTDRATTAFADVRHGILKRNGLPGELVTLYRYAGFELTDPDYVLFSAVDVIRWPYLVWAGEFAFAGAAILLGAGVQALRRRRLRRRLADETGAPGREDGDAPLDGS